MVARDAVPFALRSRWVWAGTALAVLLVVANLAARLEAGHSDLLTEPPNWRDMFPDFLRMANCTYQWLGAYLRQPEPREAIYVLIADQTNST